MPHPTTAFGAASACSLPSDLLDEEIRAKLSALWVLAFLPIVFDGMESLGGALQPSVHRRRVIALAKLTDKLPFRRGIGTGFPSPRE